MKCKECGQEVEKFESSLRSRVIHWKSLDFSITIETIVLLHEKHKDKQ